MLRIQVGVSQNQGYLFGGPNNKDYSILGSILGSPTRCQLRQSPCHLQVWLAYAAGNVQSHGASADTRKAKLPEFVHVVTWRVRGTDLVSRSIFADN